MMKRPKKVKMNEVEEIYVLNQPKHIVASIILMDTNYPLLEEVHNGLIKLGEISDLIFVFSSYHFPVEVSGIKRDKFTTLYSGCAFMEIDHSHLSRGILKLLLYCQEVFNKHLGYTVSLCSCLSEVNQKVVDNIVKVQGSSIVKPIFKARRLSPLEMYEFYKEDSHEKSGVFLSSFGVDYMMDKILGSEADIFSDKVRDDCRYCSWKSESPIMYFKSGIIKTFLGQAEEMKEIIETFTNYDIRYLFTNLCKLCGIDNVDYFIGDLDVGKL